MGARCDKMVDYFVGGKLHVYPIDTSYIATVIFYTSYDQHKGKLTDAISQTINNNKKTFWFNVFTTRDEIDLNLNTFIYLCVRM